MAGFKSAVTKQINTLRNTPGAPVWQRNYFEHIIRDNTDYNQIAEYILTNPKRWKEDRLNPDNPPS
jgi:REP element-mobilizing transposase RayT